MQVSFRVQTSETGHADKVWQHKESGQIEAIHEVAGKPHMLVAGSLIAPDEQWAIVAHPDKRYHAVLWPNAPGVSGLIEIDSNKPIELHDAITLDLG